MLVDVLEGIMANKVYRQATQEPTKDSPRNGQGQGCLQEEGEVVYSPIGVRCMAGSRCSWLILQMDVIRIAWDKIGLRHEI